MMPLNPPSFRRLSALKLAVALLFPASLWAAAAAAAKTDAVVMPPVTVVAPAVKFTTPATLSREAATLVQLLEEAHYNRAAVHSDDYAGVIPDYMEALDGSHSFFLASDEDQFSKRYGKDVYYNTLLGNIDPAYEIFYQYEKRVQARVQWIFSALDQTPDFSTDETYGFDRHKAPWPATAEAADDLWRRQLKFEILGEILNKKTPAEARKAVHQRYERLLKGMTLIDGGDLAERYLTCIAQLYDPHSEYLSADDFDSFGISMKLELVGIGAVLEMDPDGYYCTVRELVPGGPADLGRQLKVNDRIVSVGQDNTEPVEIIGMKLPKVVDMIRGTKGTRVHLVVLPANATDPSARKQITIVRDKVKLNGSRAHAAIFKVPDAGGRVYSLGVIALPAFYGPNDDDPTAEKWSASSDVALLIGQLQTAGIQGLVLDLRHNGGGYLSEAINVAGLFIHPGPVVQVRDSDGRVLVDDDDEPGPAYEGPLAVLTDRFSASASEIVAGALQNYGRAIVVGDKSTHGKGTVQNVIEMKSVSGLLAYSPERTGAAKITIQKFYLPNGSSTQLDGVSSDIPLPSVDDYLPDIGEADLPHALIWDRVKSSSFEGAPLDPQFLSALRRDSVARQDSLDEFAYMRKTLDWFRVREAQKEVSLNIEERRREQASDDAFRHEMAADRDRLAKNEYPSIEYRLGAAPLPPVPPDNPSDNLDDEAFGMQNNEVFSKVDVHLRETLRILDDAIDLGREHQYWVSNHAPLTIAENSR